MILDLTPFEKTIASLDTALDEHRRNPANLFVIDSCIQRFEYTYELSWKMLKRFLEATEASAETIDEMTFPDLIRTGCEKGLLLNAWPVWKEYRDARNKTSHTYDEQKALEVLSQIPGFAIDARHLLEKIRERQKT